MAAPMCGTGWGGTRGGVAPPPPTPHRQYSLSAALRPDAGTRWPLCCHTSCVSTCKPGHYVMHTWKRMHCHHRAARLLAPSLSASRLSPRCSRHNVGRFWETANRIDQLSENPRTDNAGRMQPAMLLGGGHSLPGRQGGAAPTCGEGWGPTQPGKATLSLYTLTRPHIHIYMYIYIERER
jgi:hypothetical protein